MTANRSQAGDRLAAIATLVDRARGLALASARRDLTARLGAARARLERPDAVLCVVGEFKQGKSALVNGLLGASICPVDDDLATASVTFLRFAEQPTLSLRGDGDEQRLPVSTAADVARFVQERTDDPTRRARFVEVALPNAFLARGVSVVDTPGVGGLNATHAAATLAFLPSADAVVFVSDASSELSAAETDFLRRAAAVCPTVLFVVTKIDAYPAWRRIAEIDTRRLAELGIEARVYPVSSTLRAAALADRDAELNRESGFPDLLFAISATVRSRAVDAAIESALVEVQTVLDQLRGPLLHELQALRGGSGQQLAAELARLRSRLIHLRGPASRWTTRLSDGFAALGSEVDYGFRGSVRRIMRSTDEELERIDPGRDWADFARRLQMSVAESVQDAFRTLTDGVDKVEASIVELLAEEDDERLVRAGADEKALDVRALWPGREIAGSAARSRIGSGWNALRGAQGGILTLGVLSGLVGVSVAAPVLIGAAVFFGGRQLIDDRKRQLAQRRSEARAIVRQYLDDLQFEAGSRLRDLSRTLQLRLRDGVAERIAELDRTYSEAAVQLERTIAQDATGREARSRELSAALAPMDALNEQLRAAR